jgi:ABC-type phosphate transport system substrate-binding protein
MRTLVPFVIMALLPGLAAAAEQQNKKPPQVAVNPCAQYGAGFVQIQGTNTCVKVNASIRVDVGRSSR